MEAVRLFKSLDRVQRNTFIACFLGWTLDALDFFLLTFVFSSVAHEFGRSIPQVTFAITLTLMMRPIGAFIFGWLGDRFGRRIPLMIDIVFYSVIELLTAFAPNFATFLLLRALFGIGMGGEWGLGASLAMESLPTQARGLFSGILQQGYAFGFCWPRWFIGSCFRILAGAVVCRRRAAGAYSLFTFARTCPSRRFGNAIAPARKSDESIWRRFLQEHWSFLIYAALLMTAFNYMSHGTQDLYADVSRKTARLWCQRRHR